MTIGEATDHAASSVCEAVDRADIAAILYRLDARLYRDVIQPREGAEHHEAPNPTRYTPENSDQILLIPLPDDDLYHAYLAYHLYRDVGDTRRANDAYHLYISLLSAWKSAYMREHGSKPRRFRY